MAHWRIASFLMVALVLAATAAYVFPRALHAGGLLADRDDPAQLADRKIDSVLTAEIAEREIKTALADNDADLAASFVELAHEHHIAVNPTLSTRVTKAVAEANSTSHKAQSFLRGLVTGEPEDIAGLAGTATGDLFVFGDVRDAAREGSRMARGVPADRLVLGLACLGLAVTAGTYATLGLSAPVRLGLTLLKAGRKSGRLGVRLGEWLGRSLRGAADTRQFEKSIAAAGVTQPQLAVRAARDAVKLDKAGGLLNLIRDVGRVERSAGARAALDALKIAEGPEDVSRIARLAAKKGGKTRAILRLLGRGAIVLAAGAFNLALWVLWGVLTLFGLVSSAKAAAERCMARHLTRQKRRKLAEHQAPRPRRFGPLALTDLLHAA